MVTYREKDYLPYMRDVETYRQGLKKLNDKWENVKLLCEINCPEQSKNILPSMTKIQNNFSALQNELISALITETINRMTQKTKFKAQVAVDILIRNLYERTADVGFLATDDDICKFASLEERSEEDRRRITNRLHEYAAKYTVYDEIIILDKDFTVLANLDENNPILGKKIEDPLLQETIESDKSFVESYKSSPLQAAKTKSHIFSRKIYRQGSLEAVGIICLCFRFENEMEGIFNKLCTDYDGSVIMIIDEQNTVIASSDSNHIPVGIKVEPVGDGENGNVYYRGLEYISKTVSTNGYQGYYGLGWKGHVMIPLRLAFKDNPIKELKSIDADIMSGLMSKSDSFSAKLNEIMQKTQVINKSLKRIVYNGQILAKDSDVNDEYVKLKPLLNSIDAAGVEIRNIFEKSVKNLFCTVISTSLREHRFLASHCIDIMDRNLYERSDDCRWWALNPTFKSILSKDVITDADKIDLAKILEYINSLYTVYTNLILFDKNGKIVAMSNPDDVSDTDSALDKPFVKEILGNTRPDRYFVSPFEKTPFYGNRHTYIYGASITDIDGNEKTVGGIGIVFDSEFQFKSMLEESLTSNENSFAVFTDRNKMIIASTSEKFPIGASLNLPEKFFSFENGKAHSEILVYDGGYYAVGCAVSSGYREYKNGDGYKNDIIAFVFEKLADYAKTANLLVENEFIEQSDIPVFSGKRHSLATFILDGRLLAIDQANVIEAVEGIDVTPLPESAESVKGAFVHRGKYVTVLDTYCLFGKHSNQTKSLNILILESGDGVLVGLIVDQLNNVLEVPESFIKPTPNIHGSSSVIKGVVCIGKTNSKILLVIDEDKLIKLLDPESVKLEVEQMLPLIEEQKEKLLEGKQV